MSWRRIAFGGGEHRDRERGAKHVQHAGRLSYYGDGVVVMTVCREAPQVVHVVGEDGRDAWGEPFDYADFLSLRTQIAT